MEKNKAFCDLAHEVFGKNWKQFVLILGIVETPARVRQLGDWQEPTTAECDKLFNIAAQKRDDILVAVSNLQRTLNK
jgi:hypothetical protein